MGARRSTFRMITGGSGSTKPRRLSSAFSMPTTTSIPFSVNLSTKLSMKRRVLNEIVPPVKLYGGEDAIFNYRVARAGFNYHCMEVIMGLYIKCFCGEGRFR
eukprot:Polyplicarium_translucidae@DN1911_c0_g1_i2.p2